MVMSPPKRMCATARAVAQAPLTRVPKLQAVPRHTVRTDRNVSLPTQMLVRAAMTAIRIRKMTSAMVRECVRAPPTNAPLLRSAHLGTPKMAMDAPRTMQRPKRAVMMGTRPHRKMSATVPESALELPTVAPKPMPAPLAIPKMALDVRPSTRTRVRDVMMATPPQTTTYATAKANAQAHPTVAQLLPAARPATSKMEPDANRLMQLLGPGATTVTTRRRTTSATALERVRALPTLARQVQHARPSTSKMAAGA